MKLMKRRFTGILLLVVLTGWQPAQAQFAGDVFFVEPSIAIAEGGEGQLEVAVFTGAAPFGAAQFDLIYKPQELVVTSVRPSSVPEIKDSFTFSEKEGVLSIVAINGGSKTKPIGTVPVAVIGVAPLTPAGSVIHLSSQVDMVLRQDSSEFSSPAGFGMDIVVTNQAMASTNSFSLQADAPPAVPGDDLYQRAKALRPEGSKVRLMVLDGDSNASPTIVETGASGNSVD